MKRYISILLVILLLLPCAACGRRGEAEDSSVLRRVGGYAVVANDGSNETEYPYVLQTKNSVWYLASADLDLMGEEAFYAGLEDILQYMEADMADARKALTGRIWKEVPPVEIRTDFCGKAGASQDAGAYYNGRVNFIKLFRSWDMAKFALLHEYVHYLTIHCAEKKTMSGFYNETVAEYVSKLLCENRMFRSIDFNRNDQPELNSVAEIWATLTRRNIAIPACPRATTMPGARTTASPTPAWASTPPTAGRINGCLTISMSCPTPKPCPWPCI